MQFNGGPSHQILTGRGAHLGRPDHRKCGDRAKPCEAEWRDLDERYIAMSGSMRFGMGRKAAHRSLKELCSKTVMRAGPIRKIKPSA
jgi:hypothetical protein